MTAYEEICIFSKGVIANGSNNKMKYYPQGLITCEKYYNGKRKVDSILGPRPSHKDIAKQDFTNYPFDVLHFESVGKSLHATQKPVELLEYLIKTYTNENETVLDNCMGSGGTGVACVNTNRNFIGIELNEKYFNIAKERIDSIRDEELRE